MRQLKITGDAANAYSGMKGGGKTRRRTRKNDIQVGGDSPPGPAISTNQNIKNARVMINAVGKVMKGGAEPSAQAEVQAQAPQTMPGTTPQNPAKIHTPALEAQKEAGTQPNVLPKTMGGGGKGVVLAPKKSKTSKVVLAPPSGRGKTRSVIKTRKIRVQLSGLKKRLTKQHTISKDSREKSISDIRKLLEEAKLIKPVQEGKKGPPDSVLRDIYKDYLLLRNRAL